MAIKITESAVKKIQELMAENGLSPDIAYLRIGVKGGGCAGLSYELEFDSVEMDSDTLVFVEGKREVDDKGTHLFLIYEKDKCATNEKITMPFRTVVNKRSNLYLNAVTLDYVLQGLQGGFTFINPNAKSGCGCGTSFST